MRIIDIILALLGLLGFAAFLGIIVYYVPQPMLALVIALGVLMAGYDFVRELFLRR